MADSTKPLSDEERKELEELRAEKARSERERQARRDRAELEHLKAERERAKAETERDRRVREMSEKNARLMEPDDDLNMPKGQKVVLICLAVLVVAIILVTVLGH
ncbi:MAG: hypothetical protein DUD33_02680 [Coriobacteriaceae bacterium]|mgnify:CR=1 FL=1|jgi:urease accessory protein UreE|nr:hypothetical protein [Olsenella sp.]MCI1288798.1 hypothetical protein [Olsenella sp.]RRF90735.1 MAG: hypothetical protein DUD33_02680 [Coriobacteriaceae bacterium]